MLYHRFHCFHGLSSCFLMSLLLHYSYEFPSLFIVFDHFQNVSSDLNILLTFHNLPEYLMIPHIFTHCPGCAPSFFFLSFSWVFVILPYLSSFRNLSSFRLISCVFMALSYLSSTLMTFHQLSSLSQVLFVLDSRICLRSTTSATFLV